MSYRHRELLRRALPPRKLHDPLQTLPHLIAHQGRHAGSEQARRDCYYSDSISRQVACERQGQRGDGALGGGVGDLARLPVKGRARGDEDQDTALVVGGGGWDGCEVRQGLTDKVDCSADVDVHDEVEVVEGEWVAISVDDLCIYLLVLNRSLCPFLHFLANIAHGDGKK